MSGPPAPPAWMGLGAAKCVLLLWEITLLACLALGADIRLRSTAQPRAAALMARLHLTAPAWSPAGHPWRHPESRSDGISPAHTPQLPRHLAQEDFVLLPEALTRWEIRQ